MKKEILTTIKWEKVLLFSLFIFFNTEGYALPFTIVPKKGTQLPTAIRAGNTTTAYYTLTNNTQAPRNNNYIKWLPQNVTQVVNNGSFPDTCGSTFDLAGKDKAHDSCTLQLSISGKVDGNSPDPHNHLFACFPGGKTCAGTNYPLNVTLIPPYAYTMNKNSNTISQCPLNANGSVKRCTSLGNPGMTFNEPTGITLNKTGTKAYVANGLFSNNPATVSLCSIIDGVFSNCADSGNNLFNNPSSVTLNPMDTIAYVTNTMSGSNPAVSQCPVLADGSLGPCIDAGNTNLFSGPFGVAFDNSGAHAYITNENSGHVLFCTINSDGTFGQCTDTNYDCPDQPGKKPYGIALNPYGTIAYIVDGNEPSLILACTIDDDGTFDTCVNAAAGLASNYFTYGALRLNTAGTIAYIAGAENSSIVYSCPIINGGMTFDVPNCTAVSGLGNVYGIALNE